MSLIQDSIIVEQQLEYAQLVQDLTSTVTAAATLALTASATMVQVFTGSNPSQIVKLPDATTLKIGQKYEIYNAASVSVAVQDGGANPLFTLQPGQLSQIRCLSNSLAAGTWAFNSVDQNQAAMDNLYCSYPGTGLSVNYEAGIVFFGGVEYSIAAGAISVAASQTGSWIYVDPVSHVVATGASLPNNAFPMATFNSSLTAVTQLNDARENIAQNLVWAITADIVAQTSQSSASGGSLEKYARGDHKHAMNINLMKSGKVANGSFAGNPKTFAVVFGTPFADANYSISIMGQDGRSWIYTNKANTGFTINAQANAALTGEVSWEATYQGEST